MPQLWIVAGPNGVGKTAVADRWLAPWMPVIFPDTIIARNSLIQAGKAAILEQERLLAIGASFGLDTTFSGNRELALMKRVVRVGYKVNFVFVCVKSLALCQVRIFERVDSSTHH